MVPQVEEMFGMAIPNQTLSTMSCIRQCNNLFFHENLRCKTEPHDPGSAY